MFEDAYQKSTMENPRNNPGTKGSEKVRPDEGQGSGGNFGADGDWGGHNDDLKKAKRKSQPIPIKERKD